MKFLFVICSVFLVASNCYGQQQHKLSAHLSSQFSETIYDHTTILNPRAIGIGLQIIGNTKTKIKPFSEIAADAFFSTYKVFIVDPFGRPVEDVPAAYSLFVGGAYTFSKKVFVAATGGPSFINSKTYLGVKPTIGFYPGKGQKTIAKLSFTNIFDREASTKKDFGFVTVSVGIKLF